MEGANRANTAGIHSDGSIRDPGLILEPRSFITSRILASHAFRTDDGRHRVRRCGRGGYYSRRLRGIVPRSHGSVRVSAPGSVQQMHVWT